jgi:hypothetical protein
VPLSPRKQHGGIGIGQPPHQRPDLLDLEGSADNRTQSKALIESLAENLHSLAQIALFQDLAQDRHNQLGRQLVFENVVNRAGFHRLAQVLHLDGRGDHHTRRRLDVAHLLDELDAATLQPIFGQMDIDQVGIEALLSTQRQGLLDRPCFGKLGLVKPFKHLPQNPPGRALVIEDQDAGSTHRADRTTNCDDQAGPN